MSGSIADRQAEVDAIHAEIFAERIRKREQSATTDKPQPASAAEPVTRDDAALLDLARKAKNGTKFTALFDRGDSRGQGFGSKSEADVSLCSLLAFWTGRDRARIDTLFRQSALMREKWNRSDYRERTLDLAIQGCSKFYTPPKPRRKKTKSGQAVSDDKCNAASLAAKICLDAHFAQDEGGKLYVYRDGYYHAKGAEYVRRKVRSLAPDDEWSSHLAEETVEYIRVNSPELWHRPPPDQLNLQNGLLNLKNPQKPNLEAHSPKFLSCVQLPVRYDSKAECPEWEAQVKATFPDDAVAAGVAWQIVAWLMTARSGIQKALLLLGGGGTGKSTFLTALINFLGKVNVSSLALQKIEIDRFAGARLVGKLANICADLPSQALETCSTFKAITAGNDWITVERKFYESFDILPFARLIFSANQPPQSQDATDAFFQRWYVLPFDKVFRGTAQEIRSDQLEAKLSASAELSGVLNQALKALPEVLRNNGLTVTDSMKKAHLEFWRTTDPLSVWLLANTLETPNGLVPRSTLINAYNSAAAQEGRAGMTEMAFGSALKRLRPGIKDVQRTINNKPKTWCYEGIALLIKDYDRRENVA